MAQNGPKLERKNGFYQQYRWERAAGVATKSARFSLDDGKKAFIGKMLRRLGKWMAYALLFLLSSLGLTALLNVAIRDILLAALLGV